MTRLLVSLLLFTQISSSQTPDSSVRYSLATLDSVLTKLSLNYVNPIDYEKLTRKGIDAMLGELDPYTYYMSKAEAEEFKLAIQGKFGGTGVVIGDLKGKIIIQSVFQGQPADKAGIKTGDHLLAINNTTLTSLSLDDVFPLLRGEPGSTVKLKIERPGISVPFEISIKREVIVLPSLPYYGWLKNDIAYLKYQFVRKGSFEEFRKALLSLYEKKNPKGVIIDLRDNMGGYMMDALDIVNLFIPKNKELLREKGAFRDTMLLSDMEPLDTNVPLVLITNRSTASAAEILTGVIQDMDRAVVIGQTTFGKGLIGQIFSMGDGREAVLTTAYYYTPSGRAIQALNIIGGANTRIADSIKKTFYTLNKRPVTDGGGIIPDIVLKEERNVPAIVQALADQFYFFEFANEYKLKHAGIPDPTQFRLTDAEYASFISKVKAGKPVYTIPLETDSAEFKEKATKQGYLELIKPAFTDFNKLVESEKSIDIEKYNDQIRAALEAEIVSWYYYSAGGVESGLKYDNEVKKAAEILQNPSLYRSILRSN